MNYYKVTAYTRAYCHAIVKAESEEEAFLIAEEHMSKEGPDGFFEETECYTFDDIDLLRANENPEIDFDYPILSKGVV